MNLKIKEMSLIFIVSFMILCFSSSVFAADLNSISCDLINSDSSSISEISHYDSNPVSISEGNSNLNNDYNSDSNSVSISEGNSNLNNDYNSDSNSYFDSDSVSSYSNGGVSSDIISDSVSSYSENESNGFIDIQGKINNSTNNTIFLDNKTYTGNGQELLINDSNKVANNTWHIYGGSAIGDNKTSTLDADFKSRILTYLGTGQLFFSGVNFINGNSSEIGGVILAQNASLNIDHAVFANNFANNSGVIYGKNINVNYSIFSNNSANNVKAITYTNSCNANNNYWANNFKNMGEFINSQNIAFKNSSDVNSTNFTYVCPESWVLMNLSGAEKVSNNSSFKIKLNQLFNKNNTSEILNGTLPDYEVKVSAINGSVSSENLTIHNGEAEFKYLSGNSSTDLISVKDKNSELISKNISVFLTDDISISNDYLVTKVNGTLVINVIGPNSTVNGGLVEIRNKNGSIIAKANVTNGTATLNMTGLSAGNYSVIVNYLDNNSNNISQKTLNLTVNKINIKMEANNFTANFSAGKNFTAKLTDELGNALSGKECTFVLKNILNQTKVYHRTTNTEGIAKLGINLVPGNWTITAFYPGDKDYNLSLNSSASLVILSRKPIMVANNYTQKYKVSGNFTAKLTDNDGKPLSGRECVLVLKNKFNQTKSYYRTTNTEGVAKLAITLIPGLWTITAYYPGNLTCESSNNSVATLNITN